MTGGTFSWNGRDVAFRAGESIGAALAGAGVDALGHDPAGRATRWFCGIGACQNCLVRVGGRLVEACLTPAEDGLVVVSADVAEEIDR
ncbi:MAG: (2Fe-2S)-binding protein [Hyphomicrobiales bacterium]|nr:(2Fe-2S)-binding protein [Hyphomicrobiales bacterium]